MVVPFPQAEREAMLDRKAAPPAARSTERRQSESPPEPFQARPGFLIRRLQQIHTALFAEEIQPERVTPIMYSVLSALDQSGPLDQTTLARMVAIDKTNLADLLERLRKRGLVARHVPRADRRVRVAALTDAGQRLLDALDEKVARAHARTIEVLAPEERAAFVGYLARIIEASERGETAETDVATPTPADESLK